MEVYVSQFNATNATHKSDSSKTRGGWIGTQSGLCVLYFTYYVISHIAANCAPTSRNSSGGGYYNLIIGLNLGSRSPRISVRLTLQALLSSFSSNPSISSPSESINMQQLSLSTSAKPSHCRP